jgi:hypothetical protein
MFKYAALVLLFAAGIVSASSNDARRANWEARYSKLNAMAGSVSVVDHGRVLATNGTIDGNKASRDLTTSSDSEADRTLTLTASFSSTVQFSTSEEEDMEGQTSLAILNADEDDNVLSVETDMTLDSRRRQLLATYTYSLESTIICVSTDAAADALAAYEEFDEDAFADLLAEAAAAAGINATFEVLSLGISGASKVALGAALGLFAVVAALF